MTRYLIRRLAEAIVTLFGVAVLVFIVMRVLPGDEITSRFGTEAGNLTEAQRAAGALLRVGSAARRAVLVVAAQRVHRQLRDLGDERTAGVGADQGGIAGHDRARHPRHAHRLDPRRRHRRDGRLPPNRARDVAGQTFGLLGLGIPNFVIASALIAVLASQFSYFPSAATYKGFFESPLTNLQQQIYPALVLAVALGAAVMRTTRSAYLEAASQDFVRTAGVRASPAAGCGGGTCCTTRSSRS